MQREIIKDLIKWKDKPGRKPLLLTGVRQCGKTYIVEKFGKEYFKNYAYINFESSKKFSAIFDYDFDVNRIIFELEVVLKTKITTGETLLFFDEIQECPKAITSLKYFCENMRELHLICAGSLLGVAVKKEKNSFPVGKVNRLQLFPMSFKEFVIASEHENLIKVFENWPANREIPELYSVPLKKLLKEYYVVGGMPEAVKTWIETHDIDEVEEVQKEILRDYADDFSKHAPIAEIPKIRWIWDSVPVQLTKENNKFVFSHVKEGKRSSELENALQWLIDAGLIYSVCRVENPELPLSSFADKTYFKVYMADIGLLRTKSKISASTIFEETDLYERYKGAFAENYVLNELKMLEKEPYFWRSGNSAEVDFIFENEIENETHIIPVEVKSADNTQAKSFRQFCKRYASKVGFKLSQKNIAQNACEETTVVSLPLYLAWNIAQYLR